MKNKLIEFHPTLILLAFLACISGLFKNFVIVFTIILIHEIGHYLAAKKLKWKIEKISIYPFGGITYFNEILNKTIIEELIIVLSGPFIQLTIYIINIILFKENIISNNTYNMIINYNSIILFFNLLPIYPLDGSKILKLFFYKITNFRKAYYLYIKFSFLMIILFFLTSVILFKNFTCILLLLILSINTIKENKNINLIYNKFLLERYIYDLKFKKKIILKNSNYKKMKYEKNHLFKYKDIYINEKEILNKLFDLSR